jgi:hypothetical protein
MIRDRKLFADGVQLATITGKLVIELDDSGVRCNGRQRQLIGY